MRSYDNRLQHRCCFTSTYIYTHAHTFGCEFVRLDGHVAPTANMQREPVESPLVPRAVVVDQSGGELNGHREGTIVVG